ncbi:MBL fold metallo-hydrolase [Diaphorobacter aerolatus]|uniref:MBL fold metallo-hydrolase n=1 Tax=Diaphorobacter aerolatus TaxID=1288495 RepID=A0A7H0GNX2_9BURK|nr:MBL fold metallo-hydrolase [Diaphorobacter aerolatus]QNP49988.1 MBL fold metallo-hydrolase [Diaphorobacter aerolatus]
MTRTQPALPADITVLERGWLSANNVLFQGSEGSALVDSGYFTHASQTVELVAASLAGGALDLLINTHLHSDHCGGNAALQTFWPQAETRVPPGHLEQVRHWDPVALGYEPTGQYCPPFRADSALRPGDEIRLGDGLWQIHAAPGHDAHAVILFEPDARLLISGDALWENGFGVVFPELEGEEGFADVGATLDLIERLAPEIVIPGHGAVFSDVPRSLDTARRRLAGFVADPHKHARHAAKVLLKYKLLEWQSVPMPDALCWLHGTAYFRLLHARYFAATPMQDWAGDLVRDLVASGAAAVQEDLLINA